jgi:large-conductance mechanosensitive channel
MGAVDMALGIIVGTTFERIVTSFFKEAIIVPNKGY